MGHPLMENRHGLVIDDRISEATRTAERDEAAAMVEGTPDRHRITVGDDRLSSPIAAATVAMPTITRILALARSNGSCLYRRSAPDAQEMMGGKVSYGVLP